MGFYSDRDAELSTLQVLALRAENPARRSELTEQEWPLAIVAYALRRCADASLLTEGCEVYSAFSRQTAPAAHKAALQQLAQFVTARRGSCWQALLLFALGAGADSALSSRAATLAITLAPPSDEERFCGVAELVRMAEQGRTTPGILSALLGMSDLRLSPLLTPLHALPPERLMPLLEGLHTTVNSLSSEWLLGLLEAQPELAPGITSALSRLAAQTPIVADLVYPIPTWAYTDATPQPLHAWSLPEFLQRMRPRLTRHLTPAQLSALEQAFV